MKTKHVITHQSDESSLYKKYHNDMSRFGIGVVITDME
jgi:hypothetical protein